MTAAGIPHGGRFDVDAPIVPASATVEDFTVRAAAPGDVRDIAWILEQFALRGLVLPRSADEVQATLDEFGVCVHGDVVLGCTALHAYTPELGEIRSLAVREGCQRHGLGGQLVTWSLRRAAEAGHARAFALTYRARFFARLGFTRVPRATLPEKVWGDCARCPKAQFCDEVAMICDVGVWRARFDRNAVL